MKKLLFYSRLDNNKKYILNCCFFLYFVTGMYSMSFGSLLPLISGEYGLSDTVSGALLSVHQLGSLIAGFISGVLPLYIGRKNSIIFLLSFVGIGLLTVILTGNPFFLILGFLFAGISRGATNNFNNSIVNEVSDSSPVALNILHAVYAVGALLSPLLVILCTGILGNKGWRATVMVLISLTIIAVLFFSRMKISDIREKNENVVATSSNEFLKEKSFWIGVGILFFYLSTEATIHGWIVKYFIDSDIMSTEYAQTIASLLWAVVLIGRLICAYLVDRVSKNKLILAQSLGTATFYILLLSTKKLAIITMAIIGLGFSMAGIYPLTIATVGKTLKSYPMAMGVLLIISGIGPILMPTITGVLSDTFGILTGMSAIVAAIVLMLVFVIIMCKRNNKDTLKEDDL